MTPDPPPMRVIEIFGEGVTDIGGATAARPTHGVVPVLVRRLCDDPSNLLVKRKAFQHLQGKGIWQKARFAKQQSSYNPGSVGCVFVLDSEGDPENVSGDLEKGRASCAPAFPMAIGIAHPCIEAWLLTDDSAIRRGLNLQQRPAMPADPESLPAPQNDRTNNPKTALNALASPPREVSATEKTAIAGHLRLEVGELRSPSLRAFAEDVRRHLRPLFEATTPAAEEPREDPPTAPG